MTEQPRKLIEVALPLDEINAACKADKDRRTGTIRNLHKWFAPMPLPAWRALLFAALVDDPDDEEKRSALLDLIRRLMKNGGNPPDEADLRESQRILEQQFPEGQPVVFDPFCGWVNPGRSATARVDHARVRPQPGAGPHHANPDRDAAEGLGSATPQSCHLRRRPV